ncbi:Thioester-containing protein 4 [Drosophila willistoni]|uniref:Thioester-containing protein 4 n=1 Tax=Drosophila willistoni TaxID=7260 RepID=B4MZG6_DROWI|nr:alpha-2-macroglobulin [Drosophila willistoni]EDW77751.1 Thioester-containing protein 4 [Drosophila willistoni]
MRRADALSVFICGTLALLQVMMEPVKAEQEGQYTIVGPGTIHSHRDYNVAVAVHHTKNPVTLKIGITGPSVNQSQTVELAKADEFKQLSFQLPPLESGDYNLTAEGVSGLEFKNTTKLNWEEFKPYIKIQTDKGKYKPGDTINYRVLFLDENLRPDAAGDNVVVWFEDSKRNRIKEEKHFKTRSGVYTGKFQLSEFATLGAWSLLVANSDDEKISESRVSRHKIHFARSSAEERVYFEVEKYVLPKYSVKMENTQQVSVKDGDLNIVLKANYTYGKPVNGKVLVNIHLEESSIWSNVDGETVRTDHPGHAMIATADMVNGKAKLDLNLKEFASYLPSKSSSSYVQITATVEEDFTGVKLNETGGFSLYPYRYEMSCQDYSKCFSFVADKEDDIVFKITLVDGTLLTDTKSVVKATFTEGIRHTYGFYGYGNEEKKPDLPEIEKKTFTFETHLNESSFAVFKVTLPDLPDIENFTRYYNIELEFDGEQRELYTTYPYREPKKIENPENEDEKEKEWFKVDVERPKDVWSLKSGQEYKVTLNSSRPFTYFVYNIIGRGNILLTERVELSEPQKIHNIVLKPDFLTSPYGRIYVYYVDDTGELRYAETTFHVDVELQNKLEITAPEEVKPGADVELEIKTEPKSFVALMAVDQSVLLLGSNNDITKDAFNWRLSRYDTSTPWQGGYSYYPGERSGVVTMTNANFFYNRTAPVSYPQAVAGFGGTFAMRKTAVAHDSVAQPLGAPQMEGVYSTQSALGFAGGAGNGAPAVRKNFAETWIFADIEETQTEIFKWIKTIPDTITNWVLTGFALHPQKGLAVTDDKVNIKTFQPFFVSVRLPYSVKRGEVISVPALVFNYLPKQLDVEVTLDNEDGEYDFVDASNEVIGEHKRSKTVRVGANEAGGVNFLIRPKVLGSILLKFTAISPLAGDAVHKSLKVVPEGVTQYQNRAFFVNLKKDVTEYKQNFELELPDDIVPDSQHVEFGVVGDLLGPVIKNLEHLLRLPSGCGEQTMSKLVPNYLVRDYLKSINKLTPGVENRIKRNLEEGYQHMIHYRHDDGSYSSFGPGKWREEDPERNGSTWLTAYVLRSFSQIKEIIKLDEKMLESGYQFLLGRQAENGSFTETGEYFYDSQRSGLTLTANALLALLEQEKLNQTAIDKAVEYLNSQLDKSDELLPKSVAIYALQKAKSPEASKHVAYLKSIAKQEDDRTWWTEDEEKLRASSGYCRRWWCWIWSHDVEITSYALLSLLESNQETPDAVLNTIRWLVAQRNSYGGFASTQDTVVGLQALIQFAKKTGYEAAKWQVNVSNKGLREKSEKLSISDENDLLLQTIEFPQGTKSLEFQAKGTGAALVQISYQYNIVEKEPKPSFKIETIIKPQSSPAKLELSVCVEYVEDGKAKASNMAILEVSLPSGYTADEETFKDIQNIERVRLVETKNDDSVVVIYFESLPKGELKCLPIDAYRTHSVANQKPAPVVLYDYYDTNKKATDYYQINSKLCDICEGSECKKNC